MYLESKQIYVHERKGIATLHRYQPVVRDFILGLVKAKGLSITKDTCVAGQLELAAVSTFVMLNSETTQHSTERVPKASYKKRLVECI